MLPSASVTPTFAVLPYATPATAQISFPRTQSRLLSVSRAPAASLTRQHHRGEEGKAQKSYTEICLLEHQKPIKTAEMSYC